MLDTFMQFHFLRPEWLLGLVLLPLLWLLWSKQSKAHNDWNKAIDENLLKVLTPVSPHKKQNKNDGLLLLVVTLAIIGMAGPTWQQKPQPVKQVSDDMVVILDLSLSMLATDNTPNRLTRVKQKLQDLLNLRTEGNTALVAFSGDSHIVTPLTDDIKTILATLPALDPFMMPVIGSRPDLAITQAIQLFQQAGSTQGRIILLTDGVESHQAERINEALEGKPFPLHILAAGTQNGAPIDLPERGYLKDGDQVVIPKTNFHALSALATRNNGNMLKITLTDDDLTQLDISGQQRFQNLENKTPMQDARFDSWEDMGYVFLVAIIPLVLLAYRRGVLVIAVLLIYPPEQSYAFGWDDLWLTPNQQAQQLLENGATDKAAELFESPQHKAFAQYKSGQFKQAEEIYHDNHDTTSKYNLANSLAKQQKFEEALAAYESVLKANPEHEDARFNKQIIEQILQSQQSQSNQNNQDKQDSDQKDDQHDSSDESDSKQDKQNSSEQNNQKDQSNEQSEQQDEQQSGQQNQQQQGRSDDAERNEDNKQESDAQQDQEVDDQSEQESLDQKQAEEEQKGQEQAMAESMPQELSEEEKQSFEQWMRRVPDDPGGLLRRKFEQQARERNRTEREQGEPLW